MYIVNCIVAAIGALVGVALAGNFTNPLKIFNGSDPFLVFADGYYYLTTSTWSDIQVTKSRTLAGLRTGDTTVLWTDNHPDIGSDIWAPEIHKLDGIWYIYYTSGRPSEHFSEQRIHVLKGGEDLLDEYIYVDQLTPDWGIDATVAKIVGSRYLVWSCHDQDMQSLCIAQLTSPSTIGDVSALSHPTLSWEREQGVQPVNEGPAVLRRNGKTFLTFSASFCWTPNYQLGLLTLGDGADPLEASSWDKTGPVFSSANGNWGTGHNGFFKSPDGSEDWNVFHATNVSGGNCDGNRYTMAQKITWRPDDTPDFGKAFKLDRVLDGPSGEP